ncbi:hypothetical protein L1887_60166 [Cichorium endivia]|nr:hypothetical protein L1887_60166 [Cichorium endivia]
MQPQQFANLNPFASHMYHHPHQHPAPSSQILTAQGLRPPLHRHARASRMARSAKCLPRPLAAIRTVRLPIHLPPDLVTVRTLAHCFAHAELPRPKPVRKEKSACRSTQEPVVDVLTQNRMNVIMMLPNSCACPRQSVSRAQLYCSEGVKQRGSYEAVPAGRIGEQPELVHCRGLVHAHQSRSRRRAIGQQPDRGWRLTIGCAEHEEEVPQDPLQRHVVGAPKPLAQCVKHERGVEHDEEVAAAQLAERHTCRIRQHARVLQPALQLAARQEGGWDELVVVALRQHQRIVASGKNAQWLQNAEEVVLTMPWRQTLALRDVCARGGRGRRGVLLTQ